MINLPTIQFPSTNAAAKAAAFSFVMFAWPASAQAPVTERSVGAAAANKPTVSTPANGGASVQEPTAVPVAVPKKSFVTIGDRPAVLFDAPSNRANKTFVILRNSPLEMLVKLEKMTKVRDAEGVVGWVENETIGTKRHVQISQTTADVRATTGATGALVFDALRGVLLEVTGPPIRDGWLPVKHRDGQTGFIRLTQVWGD